jgi:hypothetical protein
LVQLVKTMRAVRYAEGGKATSEEAASPAK